jgi:penicillin V acylase-like amidase (Ntn superfamily)
MLPCSQGNNLEAIKLCTTPVYSSIKNEYLHSRSLESAERVNLKLYFELLRLSPLTDSKRHRY